MSTTFFDQVYACLQIQSPEEKVQAVQQFYDHFGSQSLVLDNAADPIEYDEPGRPQKPKLVPPRLLPRRSVHTAEGQAAMLHAIAHIEFTAINLALDALYRFRDLPQAYYDDWLKVASEEAYHFQLVDDYLRSHGYAYGGFDAHDGLWDAALQTKDSVLLRMAIIPRGMEARGLDATPGIMKKFKKIGDVEVERILNIILRDEIGHVQIGTRWFNYICDKNQLPRQQTFEDIMQRFVQGKVKLPLHRVARKSAGFTDAELDFLEGLA